MCGGASGGEETPVKTDLCAFGGVGWRFVQRMYKRARLRGMDDEDDDDTMTEDSYTLAERQLMEELDEEIS